MLAKFKSMFFANAALRFHLLHAPSISLVAFAMYSHVFVVILGPLRFSLLAMCFEFDNSPIRFRVIDMSDSAPSIASCYLLAVIYFSFIRTVSSTCSSSVLVVAHMSRFSSLALGIAVLRLRSRLMFTLWFFDGVRGFHYLFLGSAACCFLM